MSVLSEIDMTASNLPAPAPEPVAACVPAAPAPNKLLDGLCDYDDNELTEAQKALIAERMKALQARFKAFEEKTNQQKVDELMLAHDSLTEAEAEMLLRICNNNEFEAGDRLTEEEEGDALLTSVRQMVAEERRAAGLKGNNAATARARLEKKQARLRKRRGRGVIENKHSADFESPPPPPSSSSSSSLLLHLLLLLLRTPVGAST